MTTDDRTTAREDAECPECRGTGIDGEARARAIAEEVAYRLAGTGIRAEWFPSDNGDADWFYPVTFAFSTSDGEHVGEALCDAGTDTVDGQVSFLFEQAEL